MKKLLLIASIGFVTMAAAPAPSSGTAVAAAQPTASASQATNEAGTATPPGAAVEEKKICKLLPSSGTRMAKRACLTKEDWKKVEEDVGYDI